MSLVPTGILETRNGGLYVVIDDGPEYDEVLLIPASWEHRSTVNRDELASMRGQLHTAEATR